MMVWLHWLNPNAWKTTLKSVFALTALAKVHDCAKELKVQSFLPPTLLQANTNCIVAISNGEI